MTQENGNTEIFINCMASLHCKHIQWDIEQFKKNTETTAADKFTIIKEMFDIQAHGGNKNRTYCSI